jgi:hypothetical protein
MLDRTVTIFPTSSIQRYIVSESSHRTTVRQILVRPRRPSPPFAELRGVTAMPASRWSSSEPVAKLTGRTEPSWVGRADTVGPPCKRCHGLRGRHESQRDRPELTAALTIAPIEQ